MTTGAGGSPLTPGVRVGALRDMSGPVPVINDFGQMPCAVGSHEGAPPGPSGPGPGGAGGPGGPGGPPPGFFKKTFKLDVTLEDADGSLFDASLNKFLKGVPKMMREYLSAEIEGTTFEVTTTAKTKCFASKDGETEKVDCTKLGALAGDSPEGLHAVVLAKANRSESGDEEASKEDMSFTAKKIVAYL